MKTALKNFIFRSLIPSHCDYEGDVSILNELNIVIKQKSALFYPSSGEDFNDILYVNGSRLHEINQYSPEIFIHSDQLLVLGDLKVLRDIKLAYPDFVKVSRFRIYNNKQSIYIYKLKRTNSVTDKWLFHFGGYYNEVILESLIKNQIKIPVVYAICDGITSGMGIGYEYSIPTILYPLLAPVLGIKFIITEQEWNSVRSRLVEKLIYHRQEDEFRVWLQNILRISPNQSIQEILNLTDDEIRETLSQILNIEEKLINDENTLRCYDDRFSKTMVLKKL